MNTNEHQYNQGKGFDLSINLRLEMVGTRSTASVICSRIGDAVERDPTVFRITK